MKKILLLLIGFGLIYTFSTRACAGMADVNCVQAVQREKIDWCHCEPNGNCQTLSLPQQALENAGHVNASGNPLHAGDYAGMCVEVEPTEAITPEVTPNDEITPQVTKVDEVIPTQGTQISVPSITQTIVHPSATPFHPTPTDQPTETQVPCARTTKGGLCL